MVAMPMASAGRFSPLGPRCILVLDLSDGISGLAKSNQHSFGEVDTFFVTFRDLVPRRTMPRTRMINESGFDGTCYDDKAVFWHPGSPPALRLSISHEPERRTASDYAISPLLRPTVCRTPRTAGDPDTAAYSPLPYCA